MSWVFHVQSYKINANCNVCVTHKKFFIQPTRLFKGRMAAFVGVFGVFIVVTDCNVEAWKSGIITLLWVTCGRET